VRASVIIPVWNGEAVVRQCLSALFSSSADAPFEVICVDNASRDGSLDVLRQWPSIHLIPQCVNLGFAGGITAGVAAASGDLLFLLNQDAVVRKGWLRAVIDALEASPEAGVAGCTIYNADGSLDHAGARIARPRAEGIHLTEVGDNKPRAVEYVTGAAMAIRRSCWDALGGLDQGFYPAYFEEADFCLRAAEKGIATLYAPKAEVDHLRSSREAQADPIKHWANQQRSRYRFVSKHFRGPLLEQFFAYEGETLARENSFPAAIGRLLGARDTLRALPDILARRGAELGLVLPSDVQVQLLVGFSRLMQLAFVASERLQPTVLSGRDGASASGDNSYNSAPSGFGTAAEPALGKGSLVARGSRFLRHKVGQWLGRRRVAMRDPGVPGAPSQAGVDLSEQCQALDRRLTVLETLIHYEYR
jgi:GT2 family glycosyltransferase